MLKDVILLFVAGLLLLSCGDNGVDPATSRGNNPPKPIDGSGNPGNGSKASTLIDVVDDPALVPFLQGKWVHYSPGEQYQYDHYKIEFSERSNKFLFVWTYNSYYTIIDSKSISNEYELKISKNIIYTTNQAAGATKKFGRIERISNDELKLYRITETATSYSESLPDVFTKISTTEYPASEVILDKSKTDQYSGKWTIGESTIFDFSSEKNYYQQTTTFQGAKTIQKFEFKIGSDGTFYYRKWADDFDPSWKTYFIQIEEGKLVIYNKKGSLALFRLSR